MADERQLCTFLVDGLCFGIEVLRVQEVIRFQPMTRVPLAGDVISGLINLRGQIVTAIDLRKRLELPDRAPDSLPMNVVVRTAEGVVSFLVDSIGDVVNVEGEAFERPPETIAGVARELITGVYKMKEGLLLAIDTEKAAAVGATAA